MLVLDIQAVFGFSEKGRQQNQSLKNKKAYPGTSLVVSG